MLVLWSRIITNKRKKPKHSRSKLSTSIKQLYVLSRNIFLFYFSLCVFFKFWTLNITNVILQRITAIESTLIKVARIRESYALYNKLIGCSKHGSQVGFDMKKRSCDIVIVRLVYWMDTKPMSWPYAVMSTSHVHISGPSIPVLLTFIVKSLYQNRIRLGKHVHLTNINRKELASLPSVYVHANIKKNWWCIRSNTIKMFTATSKEFLK